MSGSTEPHAAKTKGSNKSLKWFVGADHGGSALLNLLCEHLRAQGHEIVARRGAASPEERCDYPDVAQALCREFLQQAPEGRVLLVCGTGQGMAMSANKVEGIRAGVVSDCFSAKMLRAHNNAQVLCLGERVLGSRLAQEILDAFCDTDFEGDRHLGRVEKMMAISR